MRSSSMMCEHAPGSGDPRGSSRDVMAALFKEVGAVRNHVTTPAAPLGPLASAGGIVFAAATILAMHLLLGGVLEHAGLVSLATSGTLTLLAPVVLGVLVILGAHASGRFGWDGPVSTAPGSFDQTRSARDVAVFTLVTAFLLDSLYIADAVAAHAAPLVLVLTGAAVVQACGAAVAYLACQHLGALLYRIVTPVLPVQDKQTGRAPSPRPVPLATLWTGSAAGSRAPPRVTSFA